MTTLIYWFRNDLRLHDNPALAQACAQASAVLPVYCLGSASAIHNGDTRWGVMQTSMHRQRVLLDSLIDLDAQLRAMGSALTVVYGPATDMLPKLARAVDASAIHCESIVATHEQSELDKLQEAGVEVVCSWQSTLFAPDDLPFKVQDLPAVYTQFRQALTRAQTPPVAPLPAPAQLPPLPKTAHGYATLNLANQLAKLGDNSPEPRATCQPAVFASRICGRGARRPGPPGALLCQRPATPLQSHAQRAHRHRVLQQIVGLAGLWRAVGAPGGTGHQPVRAARRPQ